MKTYQMPLVEVEQLNGISMLMQSPVPSGDMQGTPSGGPNNPGGFGGGNAPERRVF